MKKLFIQFSFYTIMIWMALSDIVIAAPNENFLQDDKFKGAWFTINVPKSFIVKPSLKSATTKNKESFDSALFISPDGEVEFYVYSPQWMGRPIDFEFKSSVEKMLSQSSVGDRAKKYYEYFTFSANDKSYTKSLVVITENESTNYAFGIKYKNQLAYDKYKTQYLDFKKSLVQFADGNENSSVNLPQDIKRQRCINLGLAPNSVDFQQCMK